MKLLLLIAICVLFFVTSTFAQFTGDPVDPDNPPCGNYGYKPQKYIQVFPCSWMSEDKDWAYDVNVYQCLDVPVDISETGTGFAFDYTITPQNLYPDGNGTMAIPNFSVVLWNETATMEVPQAIINDFYAIPAASREVSNAIEQCLNYDSGTPGSGCYNTPNSVQTFTSSYPFISSPSQTKMNFSVYIRKEPDDDNSVCLSMDTININFSLIT